MKKLLLTFFLLEIFSLTYSQCGCTKIVFILDNSGSITPTHFAQMKPSIDSISSQLLRQYPGSELSIVQYASQNATNHAYHVTVPFTSSITVATSWSRAFGTGGTVNPIYWEDHLPGSLQTMRSDSIWYAGKSVDLITGGCNVRMFLFTDAIVGSTTICCSHLLNNSFATLALADFGEYNWHKTNFSSEWSVYSVRPLFIPFTHPMVQASAAIASKGGSYTGSITANLGDPQGSGGPRKLKASTSFMLTQADIDTALANINVGAFSATFFNDTACLGDTAYLVSNILFPTSLIKWDFGDGTYDSTSTSPSHVYTAAGTYQVTLIAWSADSSCKDTVTNPVVIHPPLVPDFLADTICFSNKTTFTNTTSGFISSLLWRFGDLSTSSFAPDTSHLYALPGTYPVTLIVKSSDVCTDSITKMVTVNDLPNAQFAVNNQCQFLDVSPVNNTSVITANLSALNWEWNFGDGTVLGGRNPTHRYSLPGNYKIIMIAETPEGCTDTTDVPIVISPKPEANFRADTVCLEQPTTFVDLSTLSSGVLTNWTWNIPGSSSTQNPTYTFLTPGTFPITLSVTSDSACIDDTVINVLVRPLPIPDFDFSPQEISIFNTKVCFFNTSSNAVTYQWNFGFTGLNGTSMIPAPCTVEFPDSSEGKYTIKLVAINQYGCKDSIYKQVTILDGFVLYAPNTFTPNEDGENDIFRVYTEGIVDYELLIFNRWGEEIFRSTDPEEGWNGKVNGVYLKMDTYVYKVIVKSKNYEAREYIGHVNLIR